MSLGAAALAGTSLPIDRDDVARRLGFDAVAANSLDVSSDRDFVLEFAFVLSVIAEHLSVWAEEWILWSTVEFGFLRVPQAFCTGSSIMPQKVNPDVLELVRGKTARVVGNLQSLLVLVKGLPLAYNRDLQEDKRPIFDSFDTVNACLELAAPLVAGAELDRAAIAQRLDRGHLDATTLMEYLILRGVPAAHRPPYRRPPGPHGLGSRRASVGPRPRGVPRGARRTGRGRLRGARPGPRGGGDEELRIDRAGAGQTAGGTLERDSSPRGIA